LLSGLFPVILHPMNFAMPILFLITGSAAGALGWHVLRRARSPAPVPGPLAVAATGALSAVVAWRQSAGAWPAWWLPVPLLVTFFAVPLVLADLRYRRLPNALTLPAYPLLGLVLVVAALSGAGGGLAVRAVTGGIVFGGAHLLVHLVSQRSLGAGDVKLAGVLGAALAAVGWAALAVGAAVAAVVTVLLALRARWRRHGVPHGPGLLAATWLITVFPGTGSEVTRLG
jgi:leader peptidase (prepilin peptidase)/N-methyltransferase